MVKGRVGAWWSPIEGRCARVCAHRIAGWRMQVVVGVWVGFFGGVENLWREGLGCAHRRLKELLGGGSTFRVFGDMRVGNFFLGGGACREKGGG